MKNKNIYFSVFIMSLLICCGTKEKKEISITTPIKFIDLLMTNDVLEKKKEKGVLKFFFKLNDTLNISPLDKQKIYVYISLVSNDEDKKIEDSKGEVIKKELTFNPIKRQDTIEIPFEITPHFKGKASFIGMLSDVYYLNNYSKDDMVRKIEYENFFEKDIFIK